MKHITEIIPKDMPDWARDAMADGQFFRVAIEKYNEIYRKYYELIYEVQTKHPDESRHETAKRYISERENQPSEATCSAELAKTEDEA